MDKFKSYAGQFLIVVAGALVAMKAYEYINKPKAIAPATTAAAE